MQKPQTSYKTEMQFSALLYFRKFRDEKRFGILQKFVDA
jgi:hypothetical protein